MSPEPYLIAHIVRGEPAFDIAILCTEADGWGTYSDPAPWWIIPTSGHRAYPYEQWYLADLRVPSFDGESLEFPINVEAPPAGHPDHYPPASAPRGAGLITNLAERLGFLPKAPTITRRR